MHLLFRVTSCHLPVQAALLAHPLHGNGLSQVSLTTSCPHGLPANSSHIISRGFPVRSFQGVPTTGRRSPPQAVGPWVPGPSAPFLAAPAPLYWAPAPPSFRCPDTPCAPLGGLGLDSSGREGSGRSLFSRCPLRSISSPDPAATWQPTPISSFISFIVSEATCSRASCQISPTGTRLRETRGCLLYCIFTASNACLSFQGHSTNIRGVRDFPSSRVQGLRL